mgnify:CR=1 FL=1
MVNSYKGFVQAVVLRTIWCSYFNDVSLSRGMDPVITFMLRCGRTPVKVVANYLEDEESCNYGALMEWRNPFKTIPSEGFS